jgi:hypothetical protein
VEAGGRVVGHLAQAKRSLAQISHAVL